MISKSTLLLAALGLTSIGQLNATTIRTSTTNTANIEVASFEESTIDLEVDESGVYDIFAVGHAKGRLELKRDGATIASSDQAALFALSLKAGSYSVTHTASEVPDLSAVDCSNLGPACLWLRGNLYTPEKLVISISKTTKIAADLALDTTKLMSFRNEKRQFLTLNIEKDGVYTIKTSLLNTRNDDTTIFLYNSPRPQPKMELIAKDRNSARSRRSAFDAKIEVFLPKGSYLIKVVDAKKLMRESNLKYAIRVSAK